jgi:hypothetical protein
MPRPHDLALVAIVAVITFLAALQIPLARQAAESIEAVTRASLDAQDAAMRHGFDGLDHGLVRFADEGEGAAQSAGERGDGRTQPGASLDTAAADNADELGDEATWDGAQAIP